MVAMQNWRNSNPLRIGHIPAAACLPGRHQGKPSDAARRRSSQVQPRQPDTEPGAGDGGRANSLTGTARCGLVDSPRLAVHVSHVLPSCHDQNNHDHVASGVCRGRRDPVVADQRAGHQLGLPPLHVPLRSRQRLDPCIWVDGEGSRGVVRLLPVTPSGMGSGGVGADGGTRVCGRPPPERLTLLCLKSPGSGPTCRGCGPSARAPNALRPRAKRCQKSHPGGLRTGIVLIVIRIRGTGARLDPGL